MTGALVAALADVQPLGAQLPAIATEAPLDTRQGVNFHALVRPDTVYVGQQASYQVGVFLNEDVRGRLRRNPEFVPPEMGGMLSYELPVTHGMLPRGRGGQYEVHVFERAVFPLAPGTHEIPAARLSYSLPLSRNFFSREESYTLRSSPTHVVALAPPTDGRPPDFLGAVATGLSVTSRLDTTAARVGDPLLLTVRVDGTGNVNLFPRPRLTLGWGDAVAGDERVRLDSTARAIRGVKEFDWLVTPRRPGAMVLPAIRYPYFDPYGERYLVAFTRPDTVQVLPGTLATLESAAPAAATLPVRRVYRGPADLPPSRSSLYWLAVAALPLPMAGLLVVRRRPRRTRPATAAEALAGLAANDAATPGGAGRLRALFLRALSARLGLPRLGLSRRDEVARALRREGVSRAVAADVESLLEALDRAAYATSDAGVDVTLTRRAAELYALVDGEARRRTGAPLAMLLLATIGLAGAPLVADAIQLATSTPSPAAIFADGVRAYEARRYADAGALFAAVARREPRAADAWANVGTAAWAARDSATAATGWQRALRLEPTARDLRPRLALLLGAQLDGAALVPPVSPVLLEWSALLAWAAGWSLLAWRLLRRRADPRPSQLTGGAAAGAAAIALWVAAVLLDERLAARDLAVVAASGPARSVPALTGPAGAALQAGEVVVVRERRGVWARVDGDGTTGWVETSRLRELRRE
jgi:hypothetical protein